MALDSADREQLASLSKTYARSADDREFAAVASCFAPDGTLEVGRSSRQGRPAIEAAVSGLSRFTTTFHQLGQIQLEAGSGDTATGEVYCTASHFVAADPEGDATSDGSMTMHIRYHDQYAKTEGEWLIQHRRLETVWTTSDLG